MRSTLERPPGFKVRRNGDGSGRGYWLARSDLVKAGYVPKAVRLPYDPDSPLDFPLLMAACQRLQAEMLEWAAGRRQDYRTFDGTVLSLSRRFQIDEESPYRKWKANTVRSQTHTLHLIERAFGQRSLAVLKLSDFHRWYNEAKKPKTPGGRERVDRACKIMKMIRELVRYGVAAELATDECRRLREILSATEFRQPGRRHSRLTLDQVKAFLPKAIEAGRLSLALGTAIQFETGMRQRDVIGEWLPDGDAENSGGIVIRGRKGKTWRRWTNGLLWADLGSSLVISKATTKTGAIVSHDLKMCPLVMQVLAQFPDARRIGALIVDEAAGRPYAEFAYAREWRVIARSAGIPDSVWNSDARAGAITEAEDAGAELDEIRGAVGHTQLSTTARYSRGAIGKSRKVTAMRVAHRKAANVE